MHFFCIYHSTKGKIGDSGWRFGILRGLPQLYNPFHFRGSLRNPNHRAAKPPSQTVTWIIKTNEILGDWMMKIFTLQGINISHLGKRKLIFKTALERGYVSSQEGRWLNGEIILSPSRRTSGISGPPSAVSFTVKRNFAYATAGAPFTRFHPGFHSYWVSLPILFLE